MLRSYLIWSQSLNLDGRRGTTDDVATIPFHLSSVRESTNYMSRPFFHVIFPSLFCLLLLLAPFTVPYRIVVEMPEDLEMWPYHLRFRFFTMVKRSSCTPIWYARQVTNGTRTPNFMLTSTITLMTRRIQALKMRCHSRLWIIAYMAMWWTRRFTVEYRMQLECNFSCQREIREYAYQYHLLLVWRTTYQGSAYQIPDIWARNPACQKRGGNSLSRPNDWTSGKSTLGSNGEHLIHCTTAHINSCMRI